MSDAAGCDPDDFIIINQGGGTEECQQILNPSGSTLYLYGTLVNAHSKSESVVEVEVCVPATPTPTPAATPTPTPTLTPPPPPTPTPQATPTPTPTPASGPGVVELVAIDTDITGNNDTNVGTIERCGEIPNVGTHNEMIPAAGTTLIFDLVAKGVDPVDKIKGYQFDIDYDNTVIEIIGVIAVDGTPMTELFGGQDAGTVTMISRIDTWGGVKFLNTSEIALPFMDFADVDGSYTTVAADGTDLIAVGTHPPAGHEFGDGVLARITTVRSVGAGTSPLTIPSVDGGADGNSDTIILAGDGPLTAIPITTLQPGEVVVDGTCGGGNLLADSDGDGYTDGDESVIGTDATDPCPDTTDPSDERGAAFGEPLSPWPPDIDDNRVINVLDVGEVLPPYFGLDSNDPGWEPRRDLHANGIINVLDLGQMLPPWFGQSCSDDGGDDGKPGKGPKK